MNASPLPPPYEAPPPGRGFASDNILRLQRVVPAIPEADLREMARKIWRRKSILIGTVATVCVLAVVIVNQLTPRYSASVEVMIDARRSQVVDIEAVVSGLPQDMETLESEIEVIKSRRLAERVIQKLRLYNDPEFNPRPRPVPEWRKYLYLKTYLPASFYEVLFPNKLKPALSAEEKLGRERVETIDRFLERIRVERIGRSRVIRVGYESESAKTSAQVANTLADLYIVDQLEAKFEATKRATEWLNERLGQLRTAVSQSERAVEAFRKQSGLIQGKGVTVASQQISEVNTQIILARTQRAEADARLAQAAALVGSPGGVESAAEVLSSQLIQRLREEESKLLRKEAELSQEFGDRHPRMINMRAELRDQRAKIETEVNKIVQNLRNEVNVAQARERALQSSLDRLEERVAAQNTNEVQLRALEREANANRALYETFLSRFKETNQQPDLQQADARIISRADVPTDPSFPRHLLIYAAALVGSVMLGVVLVLAIEQLDNGFRSMTEVENTMGVPALGLLPMLGGFNKIGGAEPFETVVDKPSSAFGEAVRSLFTGVLLSNVDEPPRTVLITSSLPNEGKTTLSISLARLVALQSSKKVVLIDADLRRPQIHRKLNLPNSPGLVNYLLGEVELDQVMHKDEHTNMLVITAGGSPSNPTDILASDHMRLLLQGLAKSSDLVVIDSPPVLAVSDPRVLSRLADKTVYVVRWAETRRETALHGLKQILDVGADVAGVALSMVNVKKHARYGYGDSGSYYGSYRKYYTR